MKIFSVTTVLGAFTDFSTVRPDVLEAACERGTGVHRASAAYAAGLYVPPVPEGWRGYCESFTRWFDSSVAQVIFIEERFFDPTFYFDGQPDLGCVLVDGRRVVVDYKTPVAESPTWKSQVAAYCELAMQKYPPGFEAMALRLRKDGRPARATTYDYSQNDYAAFLAALTAYRYFKS